MNIKPRLTDDWKEVLSYWHTRVQALGFVLSLLKVGIVAASAGVGWLGVIPDWASWSIIAGLFLVAIVLQILKRGKQP